MKLNLLTVGLLGGVIAVVIGGVAAVAGFTVGQAQVTATGSHWHCDELVLQQMPATLNLNFMQQEKLRRIVDRAHPQMAAIRNDARQKKRAVMDAAISEIAPLLTPEQQKKFDDLEKARRDLQSAKEKLHGVLKASTTPPF